MSDRLGLINGYLTADPRRHAPTTDLDHSVRDFRRYVNVGARDVQLNNGLSRRIGQGLMKPLAFTGGDYLTAAVPRIPGQQRDNYGGFHKHGMGPLEYASAFQAGPGSQPVHPGGVRQIASDAVINPGTS